MSGPNVAFVGTMTAGAPLLSRQPPDPRPKWRSTRHGASDLYVVVGERRDGAPGRTWLIRAYWNPWARLIFGGPILMALGGLDLPLRPSVAGWRRARGGKRLRRNPPRSTA